MTVQHVHVAEGTQAIVGNVNAPAEGAGRAKKVENNPMHLDMHRALRCHAKSKRSGLPAERRLCGELRYVKCTGLAAGLGRATRTPRSWRWLRSQLRLEGNFKPSRGWLPRRLRRLDRVVANGRNRPIADIQRG